MALPSESSTTLVDNSHSVELDDKILLQNEPQNQNLTLKVDYVWSKFCNTISEKNGDQLQPLFIQHFRATKPNLRFESAADGSAFATSVIHHFSIRTECVIRGQELKIQPLSRLKTRYNYLSQVLAPTPDAAPVPITWVTETSKKTWDFVCLDPNQLPIARFSVNIWAPDASGQLPTTRSQSTRITDAVRDEILVTGMTLLYVMMVRMNNPLSLLGAAFAKTGPVEAPEPQETVK